MQKIVQATENHNKIIIHVIFAATRDQEERVKILMRAKKSATMLLVQSLMPNLNILLVHGLLDLI